MVSVNAERERGRQWAKATSGATGIPGAVQAKFEAASGMSFEDVRVHYNSPRPAQLGAYAYTQGNQVYIGPGQERHLEHELGHVVQQKQGIVKADGYVKGLPVNRDPKLERAADLGADQPVQGFWAGSAGVVQMAPPEEEEEEEEEKPEAEEKEHEEEHEEEHEIGAVAEHEEVEEGGLLTVNGFTKTINPEKQSKHIIGTRYFLAGRSVFYGTVDTAQELVNSFAGTGVWLGTNKERIDFGKVIGQYVNPTEGDAVNTTIGIIHYSKNGTHIVPARPVH